MLCHWFLVRSCTLGRAFCPSQPLCTPRRMRPAPSFHLQSPAARPSPRARSSSCGCLRRHRRFEMFKGSLRVQCNLSSPCNPLHFVPTATVLRQRKVVWLRRTGKTALLPCPCGVRVHVTVCMYVQSVCLCVCVCAVMLLFLLSFVLCCDFLVGEMSAAVENLWC